jgi:sugar phosphate isomerase/epimerase
MGLPISEAQLQTLYNPPHLEIDMNLATSQQTIPGRIDTVLGKVSLAFSTLLYENSSLAVALRKFAQAGIANLEIWGDTTHLDPRNQQADISEVARLCRELDLNVLSLHSPFNIPFDGNPMEGFWEWEKLVCNTVVQASLLDAGLVVVHPMSFGNYFSPVEYRVQSALTRKSLLNIANIAAKVGIRIAVENMPTSDIHLFGRDLCRLHDFVASSGFDNLGLCMDTGHVIYNGGDPVDQFRRCHDRIFSIHMHDNIRSSGKDLHLVPGFGSINWNAFIEALEDCSYAGNLVLELAGYEKPDRIFDEAVSFAREYFAGEPELEPELQLQA